MINTGTVGGGGDVNPGNNTAEDTVTISLLPDLLITKTHSGNFTQGQTGATYTITVSNTGAGPTDGDVKVEDPVPAGLRPTSASGTGWSCIVDGQTVICTRSDSLAPAAGYPPITLTVTVAPNALPSVTNLAVVSGGGDETAGNNTARDATTIITAGPYTFAQATVGGGYSTGVIVSNTGPSTTTADLIFTDSNGNPLLVSLTEASVPSAEPSSRIEATGSSFPFMVPSGGTRIFLAAPLNPSDPLQTGWAHIEPPTASLYGVASFQFTQTGVLQSIAGVFGSYGNTVATIPVDNDDTQSRFTGFAIANHTNENTSIKLYVLDENGTITDTLSPAELNPLGPQKQVSRFLHQYLPARLSFKGSMVLVGQGGKTFAVVALVQAQGLVTVVPVIPAKASHVPD